MHVELCSRSMSLNSNPRKRFGPRKPPIDIAGIRFWMSKINYFNYSEKVLAKSENESYKWKVGVKGGCCSRRFDSGVADRRGARLVLLDDAVAFARVTMGLAGGISSESAFARGSARVDRDPVGSRDRASGCGVSSPFWARRIWSASATWTLETGRPTFKAVPGSAMR